MLVRPASGAYVIPEMRVLRTDHAHRDIAVVHWRGLLDRPIEDAADLDRPVVSGAKQLECGDSRQRTYFEKHRHAALPKEALDRIQRSRGQFLKDAQSETLGDR